ncbi:MAG: erythromycin esterase family protein [Planctomycetota bacterium]
MRTVLAAGLAVVLGAVCGPAGGQTVHALRSIEPEDTRFEDLGTIGEAIGDARVVVLGESDPGDGASLLLKARLVKYLHDELGFNVLVWESGMFDAAMLDQSLAEGADIRRAMNESADPRWGLSGHALPVYEFAWMSYFGDSPLRMAGVTPEFSAPDFGQAERWAPTLGAVISEHAPSEIDEDELAGFVSAASQAELALETEDDERIVDVWERLTLMLERWEEGGVGEAVAASAGETLAEFWSRSIEDRLVTFEERMGGFSIDRSSMTWQNERQRRAGERLAWFADELYAGEKLIVWCETWSALADPGSIGATPSRDPIQGAETAGQTWRGALGDDLYVIAITSDRGRTGEAAQDTEAVPATRDGSLEDVLSRAGAPFVFADLRALADGEPLAGVRPSKMAGVALKMRGYGHSGADELVLSADWREQVDGVVLIRRMFPSRVDGSIPVNGELRDGRFGRRGDLKLRDD